MEELGIALILIGCGLTLCGIGLNLMLPFILFVLDVLKRRVNPAARDAAHPSNGTVENP